MDRVSDRWIALQLESKIGWPVMSSEWLKRVGECFRELLRRRAKDGQTCKTCKDWAPPIGRKPYGTCGYLCDAENHEPMSCEASQRACPWWESKEGKDE